MLDTLLGILIFIIGFFLGVWERHIEHTRVNTTTIRKVFTDSVGSEVLITPPQEELDDAAAKEWYNSIR